MMALCIYFGIELGTPTLIDDTNFIWSLAAGFVGGSIIVGVVSIFFMRYIVKILEIPYWIYATIILAIIVWANTQYTGGWQDYAMLGLTGLLGIACKYFDISRPALLVTYVVAERLEGYILQTNQLYTWDQLITRPLFMITMLVTVWIIYKSIKNKNKGLTYV
jgi:putative tricarboxylic transport membrane protein